MNIKCLATGKKFSPQNQLKQRLRASGLNLSALLPKRLTSSFIITAIAVLVCLQSCSDKRKVAEHKDSYYTCSMHPQIMEPHPGKCPICGMNLIPIQKNKTDIPGEIKLSDLQVQLGNIQTDTIEKGVLGNQTILNALLNFDQRKLASVSSRVIGRIEKLYYKNEGDYIKKGSPLMEVYSEELNNAKQELLLALERRNVLDNSLINFDNVIQSAKTKLLLWGMTEAQVRALSTSKRFSVTTTVYSKESGFITSLHVQEGDYVNEGSPVVELADLSTLWAEAQVYSSQLSQLNPNGSAIVQIPQLEGKSLTGKIEFINPESNTDERISLVRVSITNQDNRLRPGMQAYVIFKTRQTNALSLPLDAVLRNGKKATVWVKTGTNTFKSKTVTLGTESNGRIEITSGLNEGESVVISGAYLINSEYIFQRGSTPAVASELQ